MKLKRAKYINIELRLVDYPFVLSQKPGERVSTVQLDVTLVGNYVKC